MPNAIVSQFLYLFRHHLFAPAHPALHIYKWDPSARPYADNGMCVFELLAKLSFTALATCRSWFLHTGALSLIILRSCSANLDRMQVKVAAYGASLGVMTTTHWAQVETEVLGLVARYFDVFESLGRAAERERGPSY